MKKCPKCGGPMPCPKHSGGAKEEVMEKAIGKFKKRGKK